jgi:hypothetical protein
VAWWQRLLQPSPAEEMTASPVSTRVGSPAYDSPVGIAPLAGLPPLEALLNVLERKGLVT